MDFNKRLREDELMDDIKVSADDLKRTYNDINRVNRLLGGDSNVLNLFGKLIEENPKEKYSVIDVGCGDGELLRKICGIFRGKNKSVKLIGLDLNRKSISLAKQASKNYPELTYEVVDILEHTDGRHKADFVISSLTMHHIEEAQIPNFLTKLTAMAKTGVIISDLQRSRVAYYLFKLFSPIFIKTKIAKNDGLVSIRSGFQKKELFQYSLGFPQLDHSILSKWAFRYVWVMRVKRPITNE